MIKEMPNVWFEDGLMIFFDCIHIQTGDKVKEKPKLKKHTNAAASMQGHWMVWWDWQWCKSHPMAFSVTDSP